MNDDEISSFIRHAYNHVSSRSQWTITRTVLRSRLFPFFYDFLIQTIQLNTGRRIIIHLETTDRIKEYTPSISFQIPMLSAFKRLSKIHRFSSRLFPDFLFHSKPWDLFPLYIIFYAPFRATALPSRYRSWIREVMYLCIYMHS